MSGVEWSPPPIVKMKQIRIIAVLIAAVMALASLYFRSMQITLSVIAGSAIVITSFELLYLIVSHALGENKKSPVFFVIVALLKFSLLGFVLWFVVVHLPIHTLAFLAGLTTIVAAIVVYGATTCLR